MAGSANAVSSRAFIEFAIDGCARRMEKIVIDWTADDANGSVPDASVTIKGYLVQAVTNPGSTAPTDNYDIYVKTSEGADICVAGLENRDTANSECKVFDPAPFADGTMTVSLSGNSVNSATGRLVLYVSDTR